MQYGIYEIILNIRSLVITKLFHHNSRLIRYPFFLRNGRYVDLGIGFTCGYHCRIEVIKMVHTHGIIKFGLNCKLGDNVHIVAKQNVTIGNNVLIASKVFITDCNHGNYSGLEQSSPNISPDKRILKSSPVIIGDNVWIGENVVILPGVSIGSGAIIGANAVVTKDVPVNGISLGIPAKCIKIYDTLTKKWKKL